MKRLGRFFLAAMVLTVAACQDVTQPITAPTESEQAAQAPFEFDGGQYIIVFKSGVADPPGLARRLAAQQAGSVVFAYQHAIKGFAFRGSAKAAEALSRNPNVSYVEPDATARLFETQFSPPSWGLDRVDQLDLPLDDAFTYSSTASGINVYILDTGVRLTHVDFGGRAQYIPNGNSGDFVYDVHGSAEDCHGHGTHVAGTSAGDSYGLAKGANVWAGRVVNCSGSGYASMAIAAVDWITGDGQQPAVVNMSLGYGNVQSLRDAVEASVAAGFNYSVSAGNGNFAGIPIDACTESPAGAPNANTIGATDVNDREASFSNYGPCVDLLAPGVYIESDYYSSDIATATMSGTSMSAPHMTGAIALYLAENPTATPGQVSQAFKDNATPNTISLHRRSRKNGTPNLFLYTGFIGGGPPPNIPPTASFTYSCTELACDFDASGSSDSDGMIESYLWDFGDGNGGSGVTITHTYSAAGTYSVVLTVTDDDGAEDSDTQGVTVTSGGGGDFVLTATGYKVKGAKNVDLAWSGTSSNDVDVYRDGAVIVTTPNDGFHTDSIGRVSQKTFTYQVCEAGTSTCSNTVAVNF